MIFRRIRMPIKPRFALLVLMIFVLQPILASPSLAGTAQSTPQDQPYVIEYYYKAKWGYADEFIRLFKKNHYPILKKQVESGRFLQVTAVRPRYHATEDGRWDYRVTIVFNNASVANDSSG